MSKASSITGRFAPTPSGPLHYGSLVTAVASYCDARAQQGKWLLRIEDLDTPRVVKGSADNIQFTLEAFGFDWDDKVLYQSQRFDVYQQALQQLENTGLIYACSCSRKSLQSPPPKSGPLGKIYPGYCRHKNLKAQPHNLRINLEHVAEQKFKDRHFGPCSLDINREVGDIIIKRRDGIYAYHLAVIVDDFFQQVNSIVRGADLLEVTVLHVLLNKLFDFSQADYLHIPLVKTPSGEKLSKQTGAKALDVEQASILLVQALQHLGQNIEQDMETARPQEILAHAVANWNSQLIPDS